MINRIIEFHTGPRNCGKSIYVENQLSIFNKLLYIATLPPTKNEYLKSIQKHRERRGNKWDTLEISFNFKHDISKINEYIQDFDEYSACMIDGIWTWFQFQNEIGNETVTATEFASELTNIINNSKINWYLVDVNFYNEIDLATIHYNLIRDLNIRRIKNW